MRTIPVSGSTMPRWLLATAAALLALGARPALAQSDPVGYQALLASYSAAGLSAPGTGVVVEQVESPISGGNGSYAYMPSASLTQFSNVAITDYSNDGGQLSWHATHVASVFYGTTGYASGVSQVDVYEANNWLGNVLNVENNSAPGPAPSNHPAVANFSWVSQNDSANSTYNNDALRRFDYLINRDNLVAVVGVNNGAGTPIPALLASSYNSISVGRSDAQSSIGPVPTSSGVDGPGRCKPDIVAPDNATSWTTPAVSAAAAMLEQVARSKPALSAGTNAAVVKAILMAGTDKNPLPTWSHAPAQPLDFQYGAGQLNFNWAYQIMAAGPQTASSASLAASTGWSYSSLNPNNSAGNTQTYYFQVPSGQPFDLSALLTWQRKVTYSGGDTFTPSLATLDLSLYQVNGGSTLGSLLDSSSSSIDNVQYVFDRGLPAGEYALQISRADSLSGAWDYALAWQMQAVPYWIATNGSWNNPANWNNDLVAGGVGREAALIAPTTTGINVALDVPQTVGLLTLGNTANAGTGYTIGAGSAGSLTFSNSGSNSQLNVTSGSHVISAPVILASNLTVAPAAGAVLDVSGNISGAALLTQTGAGTLILTGSNTYSGTTTIDGGTLQLGPGGALGPAAVVNDSVLQLNRADAFTLPNSISGIGALTQTGSGTVTLAGTNHYSGGTHINAGNVVFSSTASLPGSGTIQVNRPGALNVTGAYSTVTGWLASGKISTSSNGALALTGTSHENINMNGYAQLALGAVSPGETYSGALTPSGTTYRLGGGGGALTVTSNLTGANSLVVSGAVLLGGSDNYSGGTTVASGVLKIINPLSLPDGGSLVVGNPAAFQGLATPGLVLSGASGLASMDLLTAAPTAGDITLGGAANRGLPAVSPTIGSASVSQPSLNPVPEPNAVLLLLVAAGCGLVFRAASRRSAVRGRDGGNLPA